MTDWVRPKLTYYQLCNHQGVVVEENMVVVVVKGQVIFELTSSSRCCKGACGFILIM